MSADDALFFHLFDNARCATIADTQTALQETRARFASFHYDEAERCPHEHDLRVHQPDSTSCKRMAGFLSRLFRHDQLIESRPGRPGTHEKLDLYFGRTNLGVFLHGAKCVEYEHLVDADGQNIYVTDENVRRYLGMPVMLLHGAGDLVTSGRLSCRIRVLT